MTVSIRGRDRTRFSVASGSATQSSRILRSSVRPYDVSQSEDSVGRCSTAATVPLAISTITLANATRENRGTTAAIVSTRTAAVVVTASRIRPIRPPSQSEPASRWKASVASAMPTGDVATGWPARPGTATAAQPVRITPPSAASSASDRWSRSGRSIQIAITAVSASSARIATGR